MSRILYRLVSIVALLMILFSCQEPREKKFTIGFSQCCNDPWRDEMFLEMQRELVFHPEVSLEKVNANNDSKVQIDQLKDLAQKKVDLIILSPNESTPLTEIVEQIYDSGIPIILVDRKIESNKYSSFIGADNYQIGYMAGKYIENKLPSFRNIIEVRLLMTTSPAIERNLGFSNALQSSAGHKIVATVDTPLGVESVQKDLPLQIKAHPEANVIFAHTDWLAEEVIKILKKLSIEDQFEVIGVDGIPVENGIKMVRDGHLSATMLYPTGGSEAIQTAIKILNGRAFSKEEKLISTVISNENVEIFYAQLQRLKFQQTDINRLDKKIRSLDKIFLSQQNKLYFSTILLMLVVIFGLTVYFLFQDKKESNQRLIRQNQEILRQRDEIEKVSILAQKAVEEKMRFYSYISHEFRTPLSLILTPTEDLITQKNFNRVETLETLNLIKRNAYRLLNLVNQFLDLRKIDSGKMQPNLQPLELIALLNEAVQEFKIKAKNKNQDLQLITFQSEIWVMADLEMMEKVIFNIVSNALKYTAKNGFIQVNARVDSEFVELKIQDNGVGMNQEEAQYAFDLFYRANQNTSLSTGLGLSLTKEFIHLMNGEILLESKKNKGTTVTIKLPIIENNDRSDISSFNNLKDRFLEQPVYSEIETSKNNSIHENTIVLIEDNKDLNHFLTQKLQNDYQVISRENAENGWEEILNYIPDIVISDVMLPGKDGFALTQQIKEDFRTSHIPVVLLTAKSRVENQIEGTKAGADLYLSKPFNLQLLKEKLKALLENRERMRMRFGHSSIKPASNLKGEKRFLLELDKLIEKGMSDGTLSVENLSMELGMSRVQLFRKISALANKNVTDYIGDFKLQKAKILLNESDQNITEIAYQLGFSSPNYFTTFFKQKTNLTPSEYRKR